MLTCTIRKAVLLFTVLIFAVFAIAQNTTSSLPSPADWSRPYQPFQVAGNLYYVGTYDLACYLITTPRGHILINTGLESSASLIKSNVESLGFKFSDIKILLTTQAHYDHLGAMAAIKKMTGARMMVDAADSAVVADGGNSDYEFGGKGHLFEPVRVDRSLHDGDTVKLGAMNVVMLHHPGHTKGSCSYLFDVNDKQRSYRVLLVNMPTIITDRDLTGIDAYPSMTEDYKYTFGALKRLTFDLWVSSHASQFDMHAKHKPGDKYRPAAFSDRIGYDKEVTDLQAKFDAKLRGE